MNQNEYNAVFKKYYHVVYNYSRKLLKSKQDSENATIEVFISLWKKSETVDQERVKSFLMKATLNKCIDILRKRKVDRRIVEFKDWEVEDLVATEAFEEIEKSTRLIEEILLIVDNLYPRQKQLINLRYLQEIKPEEIEAILHLQSSTVRNQLCTALSNIRKKVKELGIKY